MKTDLVKQGATTSGPEPAKIVPDAANSTPDAANSAPDAANSAPESANNTAGRQWAPVTYRGQRVPYLYRRDGRFYLVRRVAGRLIRRVLRRPDGAPVVDPAEARALAVKEAGRPAAPELGRVTLAELVARYFLYHENVAGKKPATLYKERCHARKLLAVLGEVPVARLTLRHLHDYAAQRQAAGASPRTVNLDMMVLHQILMFGKKEGWLWGEPVTKEWEPLRWKPRRRTLVDDETLRRFVQEARARKEDGSPKWENGDLLADYVLLLALTGARRRAATHVTWEDVDWERGQLALRHNKFDKFIVVDLSPEALAHLRDMHARRRSDLLLFPSPVNPEKPVERLDDLRKEICRAAGVPDFTFHDLRSFFISKAVMAGVDTLTIATWVGHADGGVLIGRVYGHLQPSHRRAMAEKLRLSLLPAGATRADEEADSAPLPPPADTAGTESQAPASPPAAPREEESAPDVA